MKTTAPTPPYAGGAHILGVDCEMVNTSVGKELARVSVVNERFETVLDELVKPGNPVLDYCTVHSGVSEAILRDVTTTLADVRARLLALMSPDTILVGHSLENDLRVLQLIHRRVIDTSVMYPHPDCLPFKNSLKHLSASVLGQVIQAAAPKPTEVEGSDGTPVVPPGHCSVEDASAALRLTYVKMNKILRERAAPPPTSASTLSAATSSAPKYEPLWKKLRKFGWRCKYACAGEYGERMLGAVTGTAISYGARSFTVPTFLPELAFYCTDISY